MSKQVQIDTPVGKPAFLQSEPADQPQAVDQPQPVDLVLRLHQLEGSTQAVLATLRRSLVEKVPPTRDGLAREAAIAFDIDDDQQALAMIDEIAQTVGISAFD